MSKTRNAATKFKFTEGERVLCFEPDPTKARVLYDAKILETRVKKDGRGRKVVEYLIHFQGWNSSWDRYVPETFILQDNEEHRLLQKELADTARTILKENRKKKQRIGAGLRGADPKLKPDSESSSEEDGDSATRSSFEEDAPEVDENVELADSQDLPTADPIALSIPDHIKHFLEDDCINICNKRKVINMPSKPNVVNILENFVRYYAHSLVQKHTTKSRVTNRSNSCSSTSGCTAGELVTTGTQMNLCKEYADGIRIAFDFLVDVMLLYPEERFQLEQFKQKSDLVTLYMTERGKEEPSAPPSSEHPHIYDAYRWRLLPSLHNQTSFLPSLVYGVAHLSRMLVRLPDVIQKMHLTEGRRKLVTDFSDKFIEYLDKDKNLFTGVQYIPIS